jgi:hypothetical protein
MSDALWRRLLIGVWLFFVVELLLTMGMQAFFFGALPGFDNVFDYFPVSQRVVADPVAPNLYRLTVAPGSIAHREGARTGDLLDAGQLPPSRRFRIFSGFWWPGETVMLSLRTANGVTVRVPLTAVRVPGTVDMWIANAGLAWMLLFAGVIIWRRSNTPQARVLSLLLILFNVGLGFQVQNWDTPVPLLDAGLAAFSGFPFFFGLSLFATYAALFARPLLPLRRFLTMSTYAAALILAVANAIFWVQSATSGVSPGAFALFNDRLQFAFCVLPLLPVIAALAKARGAEREQLAWASVSLMPMYLAFAAQGVSLDPVYDRVLTYVVNVTFVLAPIGLTYSVLSRRLLDVGFALNRVAIFSGVSIVVVGVFMLIEWALGAWLAQTSHATSLAIGAVVALLLGFSIRFVHERVEHVLDRVFFRKRHEDEEAIRRFAREAAFVTERALLIDRTVDVLQRHADASFASLALTNGNGKYADVSENDPAIVSLRTWHRKLDLHGVETQFTGEFAYPMVSRGRLIGALLLGPKRSRESYAPDESDAIEDLAHHVGGVLDVLSQPGASNEPLLNELKAIHQAIADGFASMRLDKI